MMSENCERTGKCDTLDAVARAAEGGLEMIQFIIGCIIGACAGFLICGLIVISREDNK